MNHCTKVDLSKYENRLSRKHKLIRLLWMATWTIGASWLPRGFARRWKNGLLRLFGAHIHPSAHVYPSAKIYYPANLTMDENSCLADDVQCYNVAPVRVGANVTVSQESMLCTASHDINSSRCELITAPIVMEDQAWIGARAFVGMGVTIGQGAVVGATASVYKDVEPWTVVGGNPATFIKKRIITE